MSENANQGRARRRPKGVDVPPSRRRSDQIDELQDIHVDLPDDDYDIDHPDESHDELDEYSFFRQDSRSRSASPFQANSQASVHSYEPSERGYRDGTSYVNRTPSPVSSLDDSIHLSDHSVESLTSKIDQFAGIGKGRPKATDDDPYAKFEVRGAKVSDDESWMHHY